MNYKFCPKCGGRLNNEAPHPKCTQCRFVFYQNSKVTNAIVVADGRKILLCKRASEPSKGKWNMVGGFLEPGEHPDAGLARELKEETGLEVEKSEFIGIFMDKYPFEDLVYDTMNLAYIVNVKPGIPKAGDDAEELQWFDIDNLPQDLAFENDRQILIEVVKRIKHAV